MLAPQASAPEQGGSRDALVDGWFGQPLPQALERLERLLLQRALYEAHGNRTEAARRLGIHRQLLYRKRSQYGLRA